MVAGHADERALVEQVGARVTHVGDGERVVFDIGASGCAAHAGLAQAVQGRLDYGGVGCLDGCGQACCVGGLRGRLGNSLDGDGRGYLAGGVTAHAVAYAKERRLHQVGILIVRAYAANVRAGAPHELRGGAGIIGRVGLDALLGQGSKLMVEPGSLSLASTAATSISAVSPGETVSVSAFDSESPVSGELALRTRRRSTRRLAGWRL